MRNIKCTDCAEYQNEWCEKIVDSPYPDMLRDCQYWHERKDMIEIVRCKDCKYYKKTSDGISYCYDHDDDIFWQDDDFCSRGIAK